MVKTLLTELQKIVGPFHECEPKLCRLPARFFLTVFWVSQSIYMTEYLEGGNTVISAWYIETKKKPTAEGVSS